MLKARKDPENTKFILYICRFLISNKVLGLTCFVPVAFFLFSSRPAMLSETNERTEHYFSALGCVCKHMDQSPSGCCRRGTSKKEHRRHRGVRELEYLLLISESTHGQAHLNFPRLPRNLRLRLLRSSVMSTLLSNVDANPGNLPFMYNGN